jgi:hypothetical protein
MLSTANESDLPQIAEWIKADPWHRDDPRHQPEFLLTGNGLMTFCLTDKEGPLCYVRLDAEGEVMRLATQFAPESEVSKRRLVHGLLSEGIPFIIAFGRESGYKGIVFESTSPSLIAFMGKMGFKSVGGDDYQLTFGEDTHV